MKMNIILQHQGEGRMMNIPRCGLQDPQVTSGTAEGALQVLWKDLEDFLERKNSSEFSIVFFNDFCISICAKCEQTIWDDFGEVLDLFWMTSNDSWTVLEGFLMNSDGVG